MRRSRLTLGFSKAQMQCASWIGGQYVDFADKKKAINVHNPATNEVLAQCANHGAAETSQAIDVAAAAQDKWAKEYTAQRRAAILRKWSDLLMQHQQELARIVTLEAGKPLAEAAGEVAYSAKYLEWFSCEAERVYGDVIPPARFGIRSVVQRKPVGVVGIITPWNFPTGMIARAAGPALAVGCSVVVKPSELTPFSALALCELAAEAGVPAGVMNCVVGDAEPIGSTLLQSDTVRKMCFTGSTRVGKHLYKHSADTVKKLSLELGGNAPFIVFDDANLDIAVDAAMAAKFRNAGQTCICANRFLVHEKIADKFTEKLVERCNAMVLGDGTVEGVTLGPLISANGPKQMAAYVSAAVKEGATVVCGGKAPDAEALAGSAKCKAGYFFAPTILRNVRDDMGVSNCEIFGPIVSISTFKDEAEVIQRANNTRAGLAAYAFTEDYRRQWRLSNRLDYGMIALNDGAISSANIPFGGVKESGIGRDGSKYGVESFTDICYTMFGGGNLE